MNYLRFLFPLVLSMTILACTSSQKHFSAQKATTLSAAPCGTWLKSSSSSRPEFTLRGLDGKPYASSFFKDRPVILAFWASWCPNCKLKLLELDHFFTQLGPGKLVVVGIGVHDSRDALKRFADEHELSFPLLFDSQGDVARLFDVDALPHTSILDAKGRLMSVCSRKSEQYEAQFRGETTDLIQMLKEHIR